MLRPGLITAHREIGSGARKNKRPFREWYCKVKDLVYEVEDLFEDIELEIKAESSESQKTFTFSTSSSSSSFTTINIVVFIASKAAEGK